MNDQVIDLLLLFRNTIYRKYIITKQLNIHTKTTKIKLSSTATSRSFFVQNSFSSMLFLLIGQQQSDSFGWPQVASILSTVTWSMSFYGQVWENYRCKSVQGFALDYLVLNSVGFMFYAIYTTIGYFFTEIQGAGTVLIGDLIFVYHALPLLTIMALQCCYYPRGKNRISGQAVVISVGLWAILVAQSILTIWIPVFQWTEYWNPVSCMGYGKIIISCIKYSPPVYWNFKRKSTKGWSIFGMITDMTGGILSLASGSVSVQNGLNVTKLMLAILTICYDIIFIYQHYILYPQKKKKKTHNQTLLQNEQNQQHVRTSTNRNEINDKLLVHSQDSHSLIQSG